MSWIAVAAAVVVGGISASKAAQGNKAIARSQQSAIDAGQQQNRQLAVAAALERQRFVDNTRRVIGALRVAGGDSGGVDGSYAALIRQADYSAGLNQKIISTNLANKYGRVGSETKSQIARLKAQKQNVFLSGVQGALQGYTMGSSLGGGGGGAAAPVSGGLAASGYDYAGPAAGPTGGAPTGISGQVIV